MAGATVAELKAVLSVDDSAFVRGMSKAEGSVSKLSGELQRSSGPVGNFSSLLSSVASPAGLAATAVTAMSAAMISATSAAIAWEAGLKDIEKTAGAHTNIAELSDALLDLSMLKPVDASGLQDMAAVAGTLGIDGTQNVLKFVDVVTDASTSFGMLPQEAASSMAKLTNLYESGNIDQLDNLGSAINAIGNNMAATEPEIISSMKKMATLGAQYGMTGSEAAALSGSLIALGMDADSAGTLTNTAMSKLSNPEMWGKAADLIGSTREEFGLLATSDIDEALLAISEALEKIEDPLERAQAISELKLGEEATKPLMKMVGHTDEIRKNMELANQAYEQQTALAEEAASKYSSTQSKLQLITNDVKSIGIDVGGWVVGSDSFQGGLDDIHSTLLDFRSDLKGFKSDWDAVSSSIANIDLGPLGTVSDVIDKIHEINRMQMGIATYVPRKIYDADKSAWGSLTTWAHESQGQVYFQDVWMSAEEANEKAKEIFTGTGGAFNPETGKIDSEQYAKGIVSGFIGYDIPGEIGDEMGDITDDMDTYGSDGGIAYREAFLDSLIDENAWAAGLGGGRLDGLIGNINTSDQNRITSSGYDEKEVLKGIGDLGNWDITYEHKIGSDSNKYKYTVIDKDTGDIETFEYKQAAATFQNEYGNWRYGNVEDAFSKGLLPDLASAYPNISLDQLEGAVAKTPGFTEAMQGETATYEIEELVIEPEEIIVSDSIFDTDLYKSDYINRVGEAVVNSLEDGVVSATEKTDMLAPLREELNSFSYSDVESYTAMGGPMLERYIASIEAGNTELADQILSEAYALGYGWALGFNEGAVDGVSLDEVQAKLTKMDQDIADAADNFLEPGVELDLSTMISAGFVDVDDLMKGVGSDAYSYFADGAVEQAESQNIVDRLREIWRTDPIKFEDMGGEGLLAYFKDLNDELQQLEWVQEDLAKAEAIAEITDNYDYVIELRAQEGVLEQSVNDKIANVDPSYIGIIGELDIKPGLWDWGGEIGGAKALWAEQNADLLQYAPTQAVKDEVLNFVEWAHTSGNDELVSSIGYLFSDSGIDVKSLAYDDILKAFSESPDEESQAFANYLLAIVNDGFAKAAEGMDSSKPWYTPNDTSMESWWSSFGAWQESNPDLFYESYIGPEKYYAGAGMGAISQEQMLLVDADTTQADNKADDLVTKVSNVYTLTVKADVEQAAKDVNTLIGLIEQPATKEVKIHYSESWGGGGIGGSALGGTRGSSSGGGGSGSSWTRPNTSNWFKTTSFASGGIITTPTFAIVGDASTPEVAAPLGDLLPMIQQAVGVNEGGNGGLNIQGPLMEGPLVNIEGNVTEDALPMIESVVNGAVSDLETKIASLYSNRYKGV